MMMVRATLLCVEAHYGVHVADLMRRAVHTVRATDTIHDAHALMRVARIRHLPVVDEQGTLTGVVADSDLNLGWSRGPQGRVSDVMSRYPHWVHTTTRARDAAERMLYDKIGCLPVLDEHQRLVGIITDSDFLEVALRALILADAACEAEGP